MSLPPDIVQRFTGPVVWGERDCVQFAAAMREHFAAAPVALIHYGSKADADALIAGAGSLGALVASILGPGKPPRAAADAQDGDTVLTAIPGQGQALGAVCGNVFWVLTAGGPLPLKMDKVMRIWPCR